MTLDNKALQLQVERLNAELDAASALLKAIPVEATHELVNRMYADAVSSNGMYAAHVATLVNAMQASADSALADGSYEALLNTMRAISTTLSTINER